MKKTVIRTFSALALAAAAGIAAAADPAPLADWTFSEAAGRTLNQTANSGSGIGGAGGSWDVAITGVTTNGSGLLNVRNGGTGGSGTRTTFADFGPYPGSVASGVVTLYSTFASWNLAAAGGASFTLALIEGNDFTTAQFTLAAGSNGLSLRGAVDASGNGANLANTASFAAAGSQPLTVRLSVDLDAHGYSVAYDAGSGYVALGGAAIDSFTAGVNSLRLSLAGDFSAAASGSAASGLAVDRIWVVQGPLAAVPEPAGVALWLAGLGLLFVWARADARHRR